MPTERTLVTRLRPTAIVAISAVALTLAACSTTDNEQQQAASDGVFPVTIEHVYGTTTIDAKPERVASVAWANHEVPLALGIVPVGMSKATWGDDDNDGVLPWVEDKLEELGAETPVLFDETDGIDFEAVADTDPDVILASYSGITQEEYDTLSKIAPVVAYPDVAWGTSMDDMIRMNSTALGLESEGEALIEELDTQIDDALAGHPELADAKVLFSYLDPSDLSQIGFYTSHDTRPGFLEEIGLPAPEIVTEESAGTDEFYVTVSSEAADRFADVDVFVTYGDADGAIITQLQADPLLRTIPAIAEGRIAVLENSAPLAASANPSPLSIGWGIDEYFATLSEPLTAS
ncbi:iron complex transport system substrate-binding protein [Microbacteriaceae bacterium SG_E_30_P1]|uniref:Iron complex transport system substrate-binding protein n=1 Tax=Antiquaquibacter oligotrophicus TaxID=2880260 RepID=A0ABT6KR55_9MICO|nr:iron-siderophore ABC transporter substrate-binding protein [Antiquaquibacter oligotrophicus]MDH6182260.1 iron complex transport system substrate-binding protein [Antiquaquibacter oligotrophicus]UDF12083.1 iron-siderophore ABC transporter substrate-binding protein [Antiquaquibacter oligotrophicus]